MRAIHVPEKFPYVGVVFLAVLSVTGLGASLHGDRAAAAGRARGRPQGEDWASFVDKYAVEIVAKLRDEASRRDAAELLESESASEAGVSLQGQAADFFADEGARFLGWLSEQPVAQELQVKLGQADAAWEPAAFADVTSAAQEVEGVPVDPPKSPELRLLEELTSEYTPEQLSACLANDKVCGAAARRAGFAGHVGGAPWAPSSESLLQPGSPASTSDQQVVSNVPHGGGIVGDALGKHAGNKYVDVGATQIKLFKDMEKTMWRLDSVNAMDAKFNETKECIRKFAALPWDHKKIIDLFSRVNTSLPETWSLTAADLFDTYFNSSAMGGLLRSVLLDSQQVEKLRGVIVGNYRSFTKEDLDEVNWFDGVAGLSHTMYHKMVQEPGFEPLYCLERYILRGAYTSNIELVHAMVKSSIANVRQQWEMLLPTATGWMRDRFVEFFDTYPQISSLTKPITGHAANMCMAKMSKAANRMDAYTRQYMTVGTTGEYYDEIRQGIGSAYLPPTPPDDPSTSKAQAMLVLEEMKHATSRGLLNFFTEMEPTFMNYAVMPVTGTLVDIMRSMIGSTQFMVQGALGYIPYMGPATHTLVAQMTEMSVSFMAQRLEELAHHELQVVFKRLFQNAHLVTQVVVSEYAPRAWEPPAKLDAIGSDGSGIVVAVYENRTDFAPQAVDSMGESGAGAPTLGSAFQDDGGQEQLKRIDTMGTDGIVAGDPGEIQRYEGTKRLMDTIFDGLPAHIKVMAPIVKPIVGLTRGALPSMQEVLSDCDAWSMTLADLFATMKPKYGR